MEKKQIARGLPEIAGYIWLIGAVLTFLSLVTYDHRDLGFTTTHPNEQPANFFGWLGAYWSAGWFFMFGMGAYLLPTLLICAGLTFFFAHKVDWLPRLIWADLRAIESSRR